MNRIPILASTTAHQQDPPSNEQDPFVTSLMHKQAENTSFDVDPFERLKQMMDHSSLMNLGGNATSKINTDDPHYIGY